jgi:hypothetical protein
MTDEIGNASPAHATGMDHRKGLDNDRMGSARAPGTWRDALISSIDEAVMLARIREGTRTGRPAADAEFVQRLEGDRCRNLRSEKRGPKATAASDEKQMNLVTP